VWSSFAANIPRITDKGLLVEEARTNSIRNNSMQGVTTGVIGSGGALPTNWSNAALLGLTLAVTGSGTELGMDYIELRLSGTSSGSGSAQVYFDTTTGITAASGQTWTESAFVRLAAGSWANVSNGGPRLEIWELTSGGAYVTEGDSSYFTGIGTTYQRLSYTYALVGGGTVARALPLINLIYGNGVAIDVTFRIAWPQLELGSFVTSPIRTTSAAATRAADAITVNSFSSWFTAGPGTIYADGSALSTLVATPTVFQIDDGTANNRFNLSIDGAVDNASGNIIASAVQQAALARASAANTKIVLAYATNDAEGMVNGSATSPATDTSVTLPAVTAARLGWNTGSFFSGYIRRAAYFPARLTNAQLQAMTV